MLHNPVKFILKLTGITLVVLLSGLILLYLIDGDKKLMEVISGYLVCLIIFSISFFSIYWASKKSIKIFMAAILGGMFLRFILIAIIIFFLMKLTRLNPVNFIGSFFIFYLICQIYEIRFIIGQVFKGKKWLTYFRQAS